MRNVIDILKEREFIKQIVFEKELYELLDKEKVNFYIGFDPTADSLHIGHYVMFMAMAHMQRAGHRPIALIGGATAMIGDPTGRTDMRSFLPTKAIDDNVNRFKEQIGKFLNLSDGGALVLNNADWLRSLNYIDFLREVGVHFSVNKMLSAECYKSRLEKGLSFLEFNYMLMQSYDFLVLYKNHNCILQMGGDDQWSNILSGADLIRRKEQKPAYAMTLSLLTKADGEKMGKTARGAIWLSADKTSPYEFYQYWRNVEDESVENCFKLLTFLSVDEIKDLTCHKDERINVAKARLAYEITKQIHGEEIAEATKKQAEAAFSNDAINMQTVYVKSDNIVDILVEAKVCSSKGEARRLIEGGGVSINEDKVSSITANMRDTDLKEFILHKGKKIHIRIIIDDAAL